MGSAELAHFCYILASKDGNATYNGYTNRLDRRIRQHNGELKGGAKSTRRRSDWEYVMAMTSNEWNKSAALSAEWYIRYPTGKKPRPLEFRGAAGRLAALVKALEHIPTSNIQMYVNPKYRDMVPTLPERVYVVYVENIESLKV